MELELRNIKGQVVDQVEVSDDLFNLVFNPTLVHQAMVMYQLNRRQGTHNTKTRAEVAGGGAKPWRQKHTGRACQGSIRSPQWRHGGVTFGPKPRSHRREMPQKMRRQALKCVLSQKVRDKKLILVDGFGEVEGKTKAMSQALKALQVSGSTLIVTEEPQRNVVLSAHNLPRVWTLPVNLLNAHELLRRETLVMTLEAARRAEGLWVSVVSTPQEGPATVPQEEKPQPPIEDVAASEETAEVEKITAAEASAPGEEPKGSEVNENDNLEEKEA